MASAASVTWLPAHPAMGWVSMNRCWAALEVQRHEHAPADLEFRCPFKMIPVEQPGLGRLARAWKRTVEYPWMVSRLPASTLFHVLDHSFADLLRWIPTGARTLVTVHDVIPLVEPYGMSKAQQDRFRRRVECIRRADKVICVSEFTRKTLLQEFDIDPGKMSVLPNGADLTEASSPKVPSPFPQKPGFKLLMVGSVLRRKNLRVVAPALRELRRRGLTVNLLRIGQMLPEEQAREIRDSLGEAGTLTELGLVSDVVLASAYAHADALFFPSTLEGFGLPILEAMAAGCPVISSNAASLPEVGGDAALYFHPHDAAEAADQCEKLHKQPALQADLKTRGMKRAGLYTWQNHWQQLCDIYRSMARS